MVNTKEDLALQGEGMEGAEPINQSLILHLNQPSNQLIHNQGNHSLLFIIIYYFLLFIIIYYLLLFIIYYYLLLLFIIIYYLLLFIIIYYCINYASYIINNLWNKAVLLSLVTLL